jgi:hypothetical protein
MLRHDTFATLSLPRFEQQKAGENMTLARLARQAG